MVLGKQFAKNVNRVCEGVRCGLLRGWLAALGACAERLQGHLHPGHSQHRLFVVHPPGHRKADAALPPLARVRAKRNCCKYELSLLPFVAPAAVAAVWLLVACCHFAPLPVRGVSLL